MIPATIVPWPNRSSAVISSARKFFSAYDLADQVRVIFIYPRIDYRYSYSLTIDPLLPELVCL